MFDRISLRQRAGNEQFHVHSQIGESEFLVVDAGQEPIPGSDTGVTLLGKAADLAQSVLHVEPVESPPDPLLICPGFDVGEHRAEVGSYRLQFRVAVGVEVILVGRGPENRPAGTDLRLSGGD